MLLIATPDVRGDAGIQAAAVPAVGLALPPNKLASVAVFAAPVPKLRMMFTPSFSESSSRLDCTRNATTSWMLASRKLTSGMMLARSFRSTIASLDSAACAGAKRASELSPAIRMTRTSLRGIMLAIIPVWASWRAVVASSTGQCSRIPASKKYPLRTRFQHRSQKPDLHVGLVTGSLNMCSFIARS